MRNQTIDIAKFFALFLMVLCHIPNTFICFWVYSFHMPLFFFVSGLCYNPDRFGWKKGFRTLIVPYLFFNVLVVLLNTAIIVVSGESQSLLHYFSNSAMGILCGSSAIHALYGLPIGPSWFLLAFFIVKIGARYILRFNKWLQALCVLIPFVVVVVLGKRVGWYLWSVNCAALCSVFFYIAYHFKEHIASFLDNKKLYWFIPVLIGITGLAYFNGCANIWNGSFGSNPLLFLLLGVSGSIMMLAICKYIRFIPSSILYTYRIGALFILCMNMWLMEYVMLAYRRISGLTTPFDAFDRLGITIAIFIVSWPCIKFLYRYAPWTLGQRKVSKL